MPVCHDIPAFLTALAQRNGPNGTGRLLGGDLGTTTLGLALSDEGWRLASPLETLALTKFTPDAAKLAKILQQHRVGGLVLGWPLNMDGTVGPRAQASQQFLQNLHQCGEPFNTLPMLLFDERLSTAAVERVLLQADVSRRRRAELVDKMAASYILQAALDVLAGYTEGA